MPELPEVETIKNALTPLIKGRTIKQVEIFWPGSIERPSVSKFKANVISNKILSISRRGKYIYFALSGGKYLFFHLGMTGQLLWNSNNKYKRVAFTFDSGDELVFSDKRKFGHIWLTEKIEEITDPLGPEALGELNPEVLFSMIKAKKVPIKALLLDQTFLAGLGNMYADEALFGAGINPLRPGISINREEAERLFKSIEETLNMGIKYRGATTSDYRDPQGRKGLAQDHFMVAHRAGQPCMKCSALIEKVKIRGRTSCYCSLCQS